MRSDNDGVSKVNTVPARIYTYILDTGVKPNTPHVLDRSASCMVTVDHQRVPHLLGVATPCEDNFDRSCGINRLLSAENDTHHAGRFRESCAKGQAVLA